MPKLLLTGAAGFIGYHVANKMLSSKGWEVVGIDNLNSYYDLSLKKNRLKKLLSHSNFTFNKLDITNNNKLQKAYSEIKPNYVIHLAAEAGVRYSLDNPYVFGTTNVQGFINIIECIRNFGASHFLYASSSSVYGVNSSLPIYDDAGSDHPTSLYGATKKANEMIAHAYAHSLSIPSTGMRFFSAFGPWGRPDMASWIFTEKILQGKPIQLFNYGKHLRDIIYIDDLVAYIIKLIKKPPKRNSSFDTKKPKSSKSNSPYRLVNLGTGKTISLFQMVDYIEEALGKKAKVQLKPRQKADSLDSCANCKPLIELTGYRPKVSAQEGINRFVQWYREYYSK